MTWTSYHRRGDVLRTVIAAADDRRDGALPTDVAGVAATFRDDLDLLGALSLRWHTRLAGRIERELMAQPLDLESAVVRAWQDTARQMPGVRLVLDRALAAHPDAEVRAALAKAATKEHQLLALMAGLGSAADTGAARVGAAVAARARESVLLEGTIRREVAVAAAPGNFLDRLRAALAA